MKCKALIKDKRNVKESVVTCKLQFQLLISLQVFVIHKHSVAFVNI